MQLADFVVGSFAKIYENTSNPALKEICIRLMKEKALDIKEWPTRYQIYSTNSYAPTNCDPFIYQHSLAQAEIFISEHENALDIEAQLQLATIKHLVFSSRFSQDNDYISTSKILSHLKERGFEDVNEQTIRSTIIAKLRDSGVLISSCNKGYKIPANYSDLSDFVHRVNGLVMPLMERLRKARNSYLNASTGTVDLLLGPSHPELVRFIDMLNEYSFPRPEKEDI